MDGSGIDSVIDRNVLAHILLRTLLEHPDGLRPPDVYRHIEEHYEFPADWYRQIPHHDDAHKKLKELGLDWKRVPQDKLAQLVSTEPQWQNEIRWARNDLCKQGLVDRPLPKGDAPWGVWKLSKAGRVYAEEGREPCWTPEQKKIVTRRVRRKGDQGGNPGRQEEVTVPAEGVAGIRDVLMESLLSHANDMPLCDLELLVDIARRIVLASSWRVTKIGDLDLEIEIARAIRMHLLKAQGDQNLNDQNDGHPQ